jgi:hypothetical protein
MKMNIIRSAVLAALIPITALAHSGGHDIRGTIAKFDRHVVVVKRVDGKTEGVPLADSTTFRVGKTTADWQSMREGSRVVVHIGHDGKAIEVQLPARK